MIDMVAKLQNIDRRILYLLITLVIGIPMLKHPSSHPRIIFDEVKNAYRTVQNVPKDKLVILSTVWGANTQSENGPQTEALMRQLFRNGTRFAVISWDPVGSEITNKMGHDLQKEYGRKYGRDWVHLGYIPGASQTVMISVISGMAKNFPGVLKRDRFGNDLRKLPVTRNVKNHSQIGLVAEMTGSGFVGTPLGTTGMWVAYFNVPNKIPLIYCSTAVMAVEAYPFLDSGQLSGMLNGVIGAAQYETLIGMGDKPTYAAAAAWALSSAHIFIILLIVLGNVGYLLTKRHRG